MQTSQPSTSSKLHDLLGRTIVDFGGCSMAPLVVHRRSARSVPRARGARPARRRPSSPHAPRRTSATCANGSNAQAASGYVSYDAQTGRYSLTPEQALRSRTRTARRSSSARSRRRCRRANGRPAHGARSGPAKASVGTSTITSCSTASSGSSARATSAISCRAWIPALDGVEAKLHAGAQRRRHRLRPRRLDDHHGARRFRSRSSSASTITRSRSPRRTHAHASAGVADNCRFEVASAKDFPGARLRSRDGVRRAARHGRSGRRLAARADDARAGRSLDDRRAVRRRSRRGEPEPRRPRVLRGLDADVHAVLARAGGRDSRSARRPAKRACARS